MTDLSDLGEFGLIHRISRRFFPGLPAGITGIGDDCAVIPVNENEALLFTTDMLIEDRHFIQGRISARELGEKSLAVNLSDIAAMGGEPHSAFLSIGIPDGLEVEWLDDFFTGIRDLCQDTGTLFLGGDTTRSPGGLVINIGVIGRADPSRIKKRSTAMPGDIICVNDAVGDSGGGLRILLENRHLDDDAGYLVRRHHLPRAHLEEGKWLARRDQVNAMIDLSDGIESDIQRIMESSGCGAEIELSLVPLSDELIRVCGTYHWDAAEIGISGGEDYCLMCTVPEQYFGELENAYNARFGSPLYGIGKITGDRGSLKFTRDGKAVASGIHGYDHFRTK
jgi:thiamine-monophosphate kinase